MMTVLPKMMHQRRMALMKRAGRPPRVPRKNLRIPAVLASTYHPEDKRRQGSGMMATGLNDDDQMMTIARDGITMMNVLSPVVSAASAEEVLANMFQHMPAKHKKSENVRSKNEQRKRRGKKKSDRNEPRLKRKPNKPKKSESKRRRMPKLVLDLKSLSKRPTAQRQMMVLLWTTTNLMLSVRLAARL